MAETNTNSGIKMTKLSDSTIEASNAGAYHLMNNKELYEPARNNNFMFIVTFEDKDLIYPGANLSSLTDDDYIDIGNAQEIIKVSVAEAFVPNYSLGKVEIQRGNSVVKYASVPTFDDGTLKLNDYIGARTKDIFIAWKNMAYNVENDTLNPSYKYKRDCTLVEYTPDFSKIVRQWTLEGCWISNIDEGSFSNDNGERRTFNATVVYDKAIPKIKNF